MNEIHLNMSTKLTDIELDETGCCTAILTIEDLPQFNVVYLPSWVRQGFKNTILIPTKQIKRWHELPCDVIDSITTLLDSCFKDFEKQQLLLEMTQAVGNYIAVLSDEEVGRVTEELRNHINLHERR